MTPPRIGSLFTGYGGLDRATEAITGGTTAWVSDINTGANKILAHHHPNTPNLGDITTIDWAQVEPVDIITTGFPCTDISLAGARAGLHGGTRSGLWAHALTAITELRPSLVIIENVRGLLTSRGDEPTTELINAETEQDRTDRVTTLIESKLRKARREHQTAHTHYHQRDLQRHMGQHRRAVATTRRADTRIIRAIGTVLGSLASIGFDAEWVGLRAADVGAPHGRYRIFITAWPATSNPNVRGSNGWAPAGQQRETGPPVGHPGMDVNLLLPTPTMSDGTGGPGSSSGRDGDDNLRTAITLLPTHRAINDRDTNWGQYAPAIHQWETTLRRPAPPPTQPAPKGGRRLNPTFVEFMMGLPNGHVTNPTIGLTRNEQLRALGNGVVPQQAEAAITHLLNRTHQ